MSPIEKQRRRRALRKWGQEWADQRLKGPCSICGTSEGKLVIDHCHKTDRIRGILCDTCNRGIGYFKDSTDLLSKAIDYLKKPLGPQRPIRRKYIRPLATITVAELANDMGVTSNRLRRFLNRDLRMDRPEGGWRFTPQEAEAVAQRFTLANVKTPPTPAN